MSVGLHGADAVLGRYHAATGQLAGDVAYGDIVAALATSPTLGWFVQTIADQGRRDLDQRTLLARRDAFLGAALHQID